MGATWCRERVEQAQNSKSPVDRILVRCSNLMKPNSSSQSQGKIVHDFVYKGMRSRNLNARRSDVSVAAITPKNRQFPGTKGNLNWMKPELIVGRSEGEFFKPPIPPPRKKRKRKINSMEVLNCELPKLRSPGYVLHSEKLQNKTISNKKATESKETDVRRHFEKSHRRETSLGQDRFGKLSGNRIAGRKKMIESRSANDTFKDDKMKNDNGKRTEKKIKLGSAASLPNCDGIVKRKGKTSADSANGNDKNRSQTKSPGRNSSALSLPDEESNSILGSISEATINRIESYVKRCRSFGSLKPHQIADKLDEFDKGKRSASESSDHSWCGLDDWDLGMIEHCDPVSVSAESNPNDRPKSAFFIGDDRQRKKVEKHPEIGKTTAIGSRNGKPEDKVEIEWKMVVPLEWFLHPEKRSPAIMPSPTSESRKSAKIPPEAGHEEGETDSREHSLLLELLKKFREEETRPTEIRIDLKELVNVVADRSRKNSTDFDGTEVEFSTEKNLNVFLPLENVPENVDAGKTGSSSPKFESKNSRSPSIGLDCSTQLLRQLQNNQEAIEREILLNPNELVERLRRESLFRSLPKDAFEAFKLRKATSLREALNDFLGFRDSDNTIRTADGETDSGKGERQPEVNETETIESPETIRISIVDEIEIGSPRTGENVPIRNSLVNLKNNRQE